MKNMTQSSKWCIDIHHSIQNFFENVLKPISENNRQNLSDNDLMLFNQQAKIEKAIYTEGCKEIQSRFKEYGLSPLVILPMSMIHHFGLNSGMSREFHYLETKDDTVLIPHNKRRMNTTFQSLAITSPFLRELELKRWAMTSGSYPPSYEPISTPNLEVFNNTVKICKINLIKTRLYSSEANYHLKNYLPKEFWDKFPPNEDMMLATLYKFTPTDFGFPMKKDYSCTFQVILDQIPTIDKYHMVNRYQKMCSSSFLPKLYSFLGNSKYVPNW